MRLELSPTLTAAVPHAMEAVADALRAHGSNAWRRPSRESTDVGAWQPIVRK
jgi:hypothetical protein